MCRPVSLILLILFGVLFLSASSKPAGMSKTTDLCAVQWNIPPDEWAGSKTCHLRFNATQNRSLHAVVVPLFSAKSSWCEIMSIMREKPVVLISYQSAGSWVEQRSFCFFLVTPRHVFL